MYETVLDTPGTIFVGVGLLVLGSLIRFRQWTFLIAEYNESTDIPRAVAATLVGNFFLRVGIVALVFGYVLTQAYASPWLAPLFGILVTLDTGRLVYRFSTDERTPPTESAT